MKLNTLISILTKLKNDFADETIVVYVGNHEISTVNATFSEDGEESVDIIPEK